jgi:hypothetical protein
MRYSAFQTCIIRRERHTVKSTGTLMRLVSTLIAHGGHIPENELRHDICRGNDLWTRLTDAF